MSPLKDMSKQRKIWSKGKLEGHKAWKSKMQKLCGFQSYLMYQWISKKYSQWHPILLIQRLPSFINRPCFHLPNLFWVLIYPNPPSYIHRLLDPFWVPISQNPNLHILHNFLLSITLQGVCQWQYFHLLHLFIHKSSNLASINHVFLPPTPPPYSKLFHRSLSSIPQSASSFFSLSYQHLWENNKNSLKIKNQKEKNNYQGIPSTQIDAWVLPSFSYHVPNVFQFHLSIHSLFLFHLHSTLGASSIHTTLPSFHLAFIILFHLWSWLPLFLSSIHIHFPCPLHIIHTFSYIHP